LCYSARDIVLGTFYPRWNAVTATTRGLFTYHTISQSIRGGLAPFDVSNRAVVLPRVPWRGVSREDGRMYWCIEGSGRQGVVRPVLCEAMYMAAGDDSANSHPRAQGADHLLRQGLTGL